MTTFAEKFRQKLRAQNPGVARDLADAEETAARAAESGAIRVFLPDIASIREIWTPILDQAIADTTASGSIRDHRIRMAELGHPPELDENRKPVVNDGKVLADMPMRRLDFATLGIVNRLTEEGAARHLRSAIASAVNDMQLAQPGTWGIAGYEFGDEVAVEKIVAFSENTFSSGDPTQTLDQSVPAAYTDITVVYLVFVETSGARRVEYDGNGQPTSTVPLTVQMGPEFAEIAGMMAESQKQMQAFLADRAASAKAPSKSAAP